MWNRSLILNIFSGYCVHRMSGKRFMWAIISLFISKVDKSQPRKMGQENPSYIAFLFFFGLNYIINFLPYMACKLPLFNRKYTSHSVFVTFLFWLFFAWFTPRFPTYIIILCIIVFISHLVEMYLHEPKKGKVKKKDFHYDVDACTR